GVRHAADVDAAVERVEDDLDAPRLAGLAARGRDVDDVAALKCASDGVVHMRCPLGRKMVADATIPHRRRIGADAPPPDKPATLRAMRTVTATRYVTPLREGGSLPAIMEADDDGLYVVKFRGAGQGPKALIAELVAGELGRHLGLLVPEITFVEVDPQLGRAEPDLEVHELLDRSPGLNL